MQNPTIANKKHSTCSPALPLSWVESSSVIYQKTSTQICINRSWLSISWRFLCFLYFWKILSALAWPSDQWKRIVICGFFELSTGHNNQYNHRALFVWLSCISKRNAVADQSQCFIYKYLWSDKQQWQLVRNISFSNQTWLSWHFWLTKKKINKTNLPFDLNFLIPSLPPDFATLCSDDEFLSRLWVALLSL
jgi:hypothetical protein